jgi:hypothetical protein
MSTEVVDPGTCSPRATAQLDLPTADRICDGVHMTPV